jgi:hypothetical protein
MQYREAFCLLSDNSQKQLNNRPWVKKNHKQGLVQKSVLFQFSFIIGGTTEKLFFVYESDVKSFYAKFDQ